MILLKIYIVTVLISLFYFTFYFVKLMRCFKRWKRNDIPDVVHLFSVLPASFFKLYGRDQGRHSQRRKEKQLDILARGKVGVRLSDLDPSIFDVVA